MWFWGDHVGAAQEFFLMNLIEEHPGMRSIVFLFRATASSGQPQVQGNRKFRATARVAPTGGVGWGGIGILESPVRLRSGQALWRCCSSDPRRTLGLNEFEALRDGV